MINKNFTTIVTDNNLLYDITTIKCYFLKFIPIIEKKSLANLSLPGSFVPKILVINPKEDKLGSYLFRME